MEWGGGDGVGGGGNVFGPILAVNTPKLCLSAADDTSLDKL